ncbi:MAG: hypothetical protein K5841_07850 [Fretibacterium sp.]|nr:hypothetical protein [Fretibacterium sp.]
MSRLSKFFKVTAVALCLITLGAAGPAPGEKDPDWIMEVIRMGDCPATKDGWKTCTCIPIDFGESDNIGDILSKLGSIVWSAIRGAGFTGKWDVGFKTKGPQLEPMQVDVFYKTVTKEVETKALLEQEKAMIHKGSMNWPSTFKKTFTQSRAELQKGKAYSAITNTDSQLGWDFPGYTGFTSMTDEEERLAKRWRELELAHMRSMNVIAGNYDGVMTAFDRVYSQLMEQDPGNGSINIADITKMLTADLLSGMVYAALDLSPQYPITLIPKGIMSIFKDFFVTLWPPSISTSFPLPAQGQTRKLQAVGGAADQRSEMMDRNDLAVSRFQDMRDFTDQMKRAREEAIRTNVVTIAESAAKTKDQGKSHKIGF